MSYQIQSYSFIHKSSNSFFYSSGDEIPRVEYTKTEIGTWKKIYNNLKNLFPTHACKEFNRVLPLLEQHCGYNENNIPQLEDVSQYLKSKIIFFLFAFFTFWNYNDISSHMIIINSFQYRYNWIPATASSGIIIKS